MADGIIEQIQASVEQTLQIVQGLQTQVALLVAALPMATTPPITLVPTPPNPVQSSVSPLKGINIGNDQSSTPNLSYKAAQNAADLSLLRGKISRLRIALAYGLDQNDVNNLKQLAIDAKKQGFFVQFGITAGADPTESQYYDKWLSADIIETAKWAQLNRIDEFSIGNEEDWLCQVNNAYAPKTPAQVRQNIRDEVDKVRAVYSGSIVYTTSEGTLQNWINEGIGHLDRIYFNVYDTPANFQAIINKIVTNFGVEHGGLGEWANNHGYEQMIQNGETPDQYKQDIIDRYNIVKASGLPAYLFTWRMNSDGNGWEFVLPDKSVRPGLYDFLNS